MRSAQGHRQDQDLKPDAEPVGAAGGYDSGESGITDTPQPRLTHRVRGRRNLRLLRQEIGATPGLVFAFDLHMRSYAPRGPCQGAPRPR